MKAMPGVDYNPRYLIVKINGDRVATLEYDTEKDKAISNNEILALISESNNLVISHYGGGYINKKGDK